MKVRFIVFIFFIILFNNSIIKGSWSPIKVIDKSKDLRAIGYNPQNKILRDAGGWIFITYRKVYKDAIGSIYQNYVSFSIDNGDSWSILGDDESTGPLQVVPRGSDGGNYNQRVGSMAIDKNGVIHFVWYGKDPDNTGSNERQIKYSAYRNGDWSDWINIASIEGYVDQDYWQEHPEITIGYSGNLYVVWEGRDKDNPDAQTIKFAESLDGGYTWKVWNTGNTWKNITGKGADNIKNATDLFNKGQARPIIMAIYNTTLQKDILYVLWYGGAEGHPNICYSYSLDLGNSWSDWNIIAGQSTLYYEKYIDAAFDKNGNLHVVWAGQDASTGDSYAIKYSVGEDTNSNGIIELNEWSHWTNISNPPTDYYDEHPNIAIDSNDNIHVVYERTYKYFGRDIIFTSYAQIYYKNKLNGLGWSSDIQLSSSSKNINIYPYLRWSNYYANGGPLEVIWIGGDKNDDEYFDIVYRYNNSYYMNPPGAGARSASVLKSLTLGDIDMSEGESIAYPNPFDMDKDDKINFMIKFKEGEVVAKYLYIMNMMGEIVYSEEVNQKYLLDIPFSWNGINKDGRKVENGLYFFRIKVKYSTGREEISEVGKFFIK